MDWIVDPLSSFNTLDIYLSDTCPNVFNQCTCTGGLNVCSVEKSLIINPK